MKRMSRYQLILNPLAGKGAAAEAIPEIEAAFRRLGLEYDIALTEHPFHAAELTQNAVEAGCEIVVAVGGDGTANEVLNGIMLARQVGANGVKFGVLPIGRGNDFAFSMGIPTDFEAACQNLAAAEAHPIDAGFIKGGLYPQGRYFCNGVGIGFDAVVGFVAAESRLTGFIAYLVAALKTMFLYFKAPTIEIQLDDETITQPCLMISIMNGRRMGGGFFMAPQSARDDGKFDLCIAAQVGRIRMLDLIGKITKGAQIHDPAIKMRRTTRITAKAVAGSLPAHADGETICTQGDILEMSIVPNAIQLICPPQPPALV